jgi:hypothetical protein
MTSHKKPGVAFWATVALVVVVLYVLSVGPVCWLSSRANSGASAVSSIYQPLIWIVYRSEVAEDALQWYSRAGTATDWLWIRGNWIKRLEDPQGWKFYRYDTNGRRFPNKLSE